jgi:guanylate kinase
MKRGNLLVISAPSGTGKTTICRRVAKRVERISLSVSYTTRPMKEKEREGVDYHFIDDGAFSAMIEKGEFLEWAKIYGYRYGTSKKAAEECLRSGKDFLLEIDVQGGMNVKEIVPEAVLIAIFPPDGETLYQRLRKRKRESDGEIEARMNEAMKELGILVDYDYFVINRDLEKAINDVILITESQDFRVDRNREFLQNLILKFGR